MFLTLYNKTQKSVCFS